MYQSQNIRSTITTTTTAAAATLATQADIKYIQIDPNNFNNFNNQVEFACGGVKNYYQPSQVYIEQQQQQPEEFQQQQQLYLVRNDNDARLSQATQNGNDETSVAFAFDKIGAVINGKEFSEFQDYKRDDLLQQQQQQQQQRSRQLTRESTTQEQKQQQQQQRLQLCLNEAASIAQNQQQVNSFRAAQSLNNKINNNNNNNSSESIGNQSECLKETQQRREEDPLGFLEKFPNARAAAGQQQRLSQQTPLAEQQQQQQQANANQGQQLQYQQINQQYQQLKETIYRETRAFFYDDYHPQASNGKKVEENNREEEEEHEDESMANEQQQQQRQLHEQQMQFKQANNNTNNYGNGLYASIYDDSMKQQQQQQEEKPFVEIVEQPAKCSLRFRYKCEGRSAGSLPGVNSSADNKTYPSIRIQNYTGRAVVVISCVTKEAPYLAHPHNIVGKEGCKKGICTVVVNNEPDAVRSFSSLGIQCVKRKDIEESLSLRESINVDPFRNGFAHKLNASNIDLNAVRLCFQVFVEGSTANKCDVPLAPVVSEPIHDKKAMSDLVITKLSHCSAPASGGREVILLCDRISRDDIQIRFYEERPADGKLIWETYTELASTDVHKQVAICFRTPKYFNEHIQQPVTARIQLKRLSDNQFSEPRMFQFLPSESDEEIISRKRQKIQWVNQQHQHQHQHHHQQQQQLNQAIHQQQQQHHNQHHHTNLTNHQQPAGGNILQGQHRLQPQPQAIGVNMQHRAQASSSRAGGLQAAAAAAAAARQQGSTSPAAGYTNQTTTSTSASQANQNRPSQQQPAGRGSASPQSRIASPAAPNECDFSHQPQVVAVLPAPVAANTMIDGRAAAAAALHQQGSSPTPLAQTTPTHHHQHHQQHHQHQHHNNSNNPRNRSTQMHEQDDINYMIEQQQQQHNLVVRREIIDIDGKVMRLVDRPSQQQSPQQQQQANNQASSNGRIVRDGAGQNAANRDEPVAAASNVAAAAEQHEADNKLAGPLASSLDRIDTAELMRDMTFNSNIMDLNLGSSLSIHLNGGNNHSANQTNYTTPP